MSFNGEYPTFYPMAVVMFAPFFTICEIFAKQEKCKNFDLDNEDQEVEKLEMLESITVNFIIILATWKYTFMQKDTHLHKHTQTETGLPIRGKLQICLKTHQLPENWLLEDIWWLVFIIQTHQYRLLW